MDDVRGMGTQVSVLGRIAVQLDGREVDLGTPRQRSIVAALALSDGRAVAFDAIVDRVWGSAAPVTAVGTLQRYVASLRGALEPGRGGDRSPSILVTEGAAYALRVAGGCRDVDRFHEGVTEARRILSVVPDHLRPAATSAQAADVMSAYDLLTQVLNLWRGQPYADLGEHDSQVVAERSRLEDLHACALELRLIALLAMGRHVETIGDLESMTALHPLHERWWALRAVALVRSGRQGEALEVLGDLRSMLADELGVDPSPPLQDLYADILRQDPSVEWQGGPVAGHLGPLTSRQTFARRVTRPAPAQPRWPLVGRAREFDTLGTCVDDAHQGRFRSALVTGEAGAGKTRIVQELMLTAHEQGVTVVLSHSSQQAPALWPIRAALECLDDETTDVALLQAQPADFGTWQHAIQALRRATSIAPVLMVVEDVQWADTATLEFLEHLVTAQDLGSLALVLTRRTKDGDDPRISRLAAAVARAEGLRLDLVRLAPASARLLAMTVNPGLDDSDAVCGHGGGNAFFITELALAGGSVGGGLADVVRTRVAQLDEPARRAIDAASTVDGVFDLDLLAAMLDCTPSDAETTLEPALRAGLVLGHGRGPSSFSFEHEVVREVLRCDLSVATRTRCRHAADELRRTRRAHRVECSVAESSAESPRPDELVMRASSWPAVAGVMHDLASAQTARAS